MTTEQNAIWDYLLANAQGLSNVKKIDDIANAIGVPPQGTNNDDVRGSIRSAVIDYGKQIGTSNRGAYIIITDADLDTAKKFVKNYQDRVDAIIRNGLY